MTQQSTTGTSLLGSEMQCAAIRRWHPNVLLVGSAHANQRVLGELLPLCRAPIHEVVEDAEWCAMQRGTVVLRQAERLDTAQQNCLVDWLGRRVNQVQIVSLASTCLLDMVRVGSFLDTLFYRLNVITLLTD